MIESLVAGGPVMIPIGLCSIIALATFLERMLALRRVRIVPSAFGAELVEMVRQRRWGDAVAICRKYDVSASRVLEVAPSPTCKSSPPQSAVRRPQWSRSNRYTCKLQLSLSIFVHVKVNTNMREVLLTIGVGSLRTPDERGCARPRHMQGRSHNSQHTTSERAQRLAQLYVHCLGQRAGRGSRRRGRSAAA